MLSRPPFITRLAHSFATAGLLAASSLPVLAIEAEPPSNAGLAASAGAAAGPAKDNDSDDVERWNAHFQSTYVWQRKPSFNSPYQGPNSLSGDRAKSYSLTATAALGLRLGPNTEFYFNPEVAQGIAFSGLVGLGSFSNGELAKTAGSKPKLYVSRLFVRHVFNLGGETQTIEGDTNQLGARYDKRRLVFTAGKISLLDNFDTNAYAHDPRSQFLNWTLMTHGAYDYAADSRGYTNGVSLEYFDEGWSAKYGRFAQPREPNGLPLDNDLLRHYGDQLEIGRSYSFGSQSGVVRVLAFRNRAVMTRYSDALAIAAATTPAAVPTLASARNTEQTKIGLGVAVEHKLRDNIGLFARAMKADGKTETYAFTEVDRSVSGGVSVTGDSWGRHQDTVGLGAGATFLAGDHRRFLALGGTTFFLGDGQLNYGAEKLVEAYYRFGLSKGWSLTFDAQRIQNPGYNRDRGPVAFYGVRLHWQN